MTEPTVEEYMTIARKDYNSGTNKKYMIELKAQFLLELGDNAFSGTNGEDAVEHIENFLKIVNFLNVPNIETNGANIKFEWDPTNIKFESWLASKFRNHKTIDRHTKNALWDYWRRGDDKEVITDKELSNLRNDNLIKENEIAQIFRIDTDIFLFETPLCEAFKEFNYLSQIDVMCLLKIYLDLSLMRNIKIIGSMSGMMKYHGSMKSYGLMMEYGLNLSILLFMNAINFVSKMGLLNSLHTTGRKMGIATLETYLDSFDKAIQFAMKNMNGTL
ncbi:hypothetical protein Tco_0627656 [Tanacetum coccineum]|uniref:Core-binding (CB) domain-containing protein n=1 Tax=Tanacetum coccineum TaxID=301880 RepID=A0ABQ4WN29_9ASTR